jgi:hypothetical protein
MEPYWLNCIRAGGDLKSSDVKQHIKHFLVGFTRRIARGFCPTIIKKQAGFNAAVFPS